MQTLSSRSTAVAVAIRDRVPFKTYGALSADKGHKGRGILSNPDDLARWADDREFIIYSVYSYATPIAWYTRENGWHRVAQKFSVTTSKHQGKLYLAE